MKHLVTFMIVVFVAAFAMATSYEASAAERGYRYRTVKAKAKPARVYVPGRYAYAPRRYYRGPRYAFYGRPASVAANGLCQRDTGTPTSQLNFRNRCDTEEFWNRIQQGGRRR